MNLTDAPAFEWSHFVTPVQATGSMTTISFTVENDPTYFVIDDVSVPEPGALALLVTMLAGLGVVLRKKLA